MKNEQHLSIRGKRVLRFVQALDVKVTSINPEIHNPEGDCISIKTDAHYTLIVSTERDHAEITLVQDFGYPKHPETITEWESLDKFRRGFVKLLKEWRS